MPLLRYFVFVGCLLLALLFVAGWFWPNDPKALTQQALMETHVEQTIRIQSERRWPDKIEFDTTQPTIVPSPTMVVIASPPPAAPVAAANSPLDARAEVRPVAPPAPPPKRQAKLRNRNSRPDYWRSPSAVASVNPMAPSWPFRWQ